MLAYVIHSSENDNSPSLSVAIPIPIQDSEELFEISSALAKITLASSHDFLLIYMKPSLRYIAKGFDYLILSAFKKISSAS